MKSSSPNYSFLTFFFHLDIDECQLYKRRENFACGETATCVNNMGGYDCVEKKNKTLPIVIGKVTQLLLAVHFIFSPFLLSFFPLCFSCGFSRV